MGKTQAAKNYLFKFQEGVDNYHDSLKVEYYLQVGRVLAIIDEADKAFNAIKDALELSSKMGDKYLKDKSKIQLIEFYRKFRLSNNIPKLKKDLMENPPEDVVLLSRFYHRIAAYYNEFPRDSLKKYPHSIDSALLYTKKSLAISKKHDLYGQQYVGYREAALIYSKKTHLLSIEKAKVYIDSAILSLRGEKNIHYYYVLNMKASIFLSEGKLDSCLSLSLPMIPKIKALNYYPILVRLYTNAANAYMGLGDSLNGYKYKLAKNKLISEHDIQVHRSEIRNLTSLYNLEQSNRLLAKNELALLKTTKTRNLSIVAGLFFLLSTFIVIAYYNKVKKKNKMLQKLITENEFLLGESNHRIKNNLQLIISLIEREALKNKKPKKELFRLSKKINAIAVLHQQLYLSDSIDKISINEYLLNIKESFKLMMEQDAIQFYLKVEEAEISIDKAVYIGLITTELIINSIKHAFGNNAQKTIRVELSNPEKNLIRIHYSDNGKGIQGNKSPTLVNLLLKQLKASVKHENSEGYSLNFTFAI